MNNEIVLVGEAVAGEAAKARKKLNELVQNLNKSTFDVAEILHQFKKNKWYQPEHESWPDFLKTLDIKQTKAYYLERIADVMEQVEIVRNTYEPVGTNKLRAITRLEPNETWTNPETGEETPMREFIQELVEKGRGMSLADIKQHVRTLKGQIGENDIINKTFGWTRVTWDSVISKAIELAKRALGSAGRDSEGEAVEYSDSKAVEVWAVEFLNNPANNVLEEEEVV